MSPLSRSSHALVTGGGRGIGLAISAALSKAGATVTVLGRNRATLDEAVASGAAQFAAVADVADQASVRSAIAEAAARQSIDMLIANAGAAESAPFGRSDAALFRRMMDVNFMGVIHATQAVLPGMVERRPWADRCRRIHRRPQGLRLRLGLQRSEARRHRPRPFAGAGNREERRHRQRGLPRLHRNRSAGRLDRQHHQEDRPQPRTGDRGTGEAQSAGASRGAIGSR